MTIEQAIGRGRRYLLTFDALIVASFVLWWWSHGHGGVGTLSRLCAALAAVFALLAGHCNGYVAGYRAACRLLTDTRRDAL